MNILVIAPHRDGEGVGLGRTIAKHNSDANVAAVVSVIFHGDDRFVRYS